MYKKSKNKKKQNFGYIGTTHKNIDILYDKKIKKTNKLGDSKFMR